LLSARRLALAAAALVLAGCAYLPGRQPPRVNVVGVESLKGEGLEIRFAMKLRVQNPNDVPIEFDGITIDLDVNGRPLASGVSNATGSVPRFGETVVVVPVTVSATAAVQQMLGLLDGPPRGELPYEMRGRLAGGPFGGTAFAAEGVLRLPK